MCHPLPGEACSGSPEVTPLEDGRCQVSRPRAALGRQPAPACTPGRDDAVKRRGLVYLPALSVGCCHCHPRRDLKQHRFTLTILIEGRKSEMGLIGCKLQVAVRGHGHADPFLCRFQRLPAFRGWQPPPSPSLQSSISSSISDALPPSSTAKAPCDAVRFT